MIGSVDAIADAGAFHFRREIVRDEDMVDAALAREAVDVFVVPAAVQASARCAAVVRRPYFLVNSPQTSGYSGWAGVKLKSPARIAEAGTMGAASWNMKVGGAVESQVPPTRSALRTMP